MKRITTVLSATLMLAAINAYGQSAPSSLPDQAIPQSSEQSQTITPERKPHGRSKGAASDVGHGAADVGKGVGKGAGDLAKGTGKGAVDLVTLHPVNAATDIGTGAGKAGGHVAVGVAKGTGKIVEGTGKALKKIF